MRDQGRIYKDLKFFFFWKKRLWLLSYEEGEFKWVTDRQKAGIFTVQQYLFMPPGRHDTCFEVHEQEH